MSLRSILLWAAAAVGVAILVSSLLLIVATTAIHAITLELGAAVESVEVAEQAQVVLLLHSRARDPIVRANLEGQLRELLGRAEQFASGPAEVRLLSQANAAIETYLRGEGSGSELDAAFSALGEVSQYNVVEARESIERSNRWDRISNALGIGFAAAMLALVVVLGAFIRSRAIRPLKEFSETLLRYEAGDIEARALEQGPGELREAAHRFNKFADALRAQQERQLAFLAGVAHDLRNPIAALKSAAALHSAGRTPTPEAAARTMGVVGRQVDRLDRMVSDLLDAARVQAAEFDLHLEVQDVRLLAHESIELFRPTAPRHELVFEAPEAPVMVRCDAARIAQVLNNLISNAIKYSPDGGRVVVSVERQGREAVLSVSDQGIGIAAEDLDALFQPFRRVGDRRGEIPGVGLGLYVALRLVEAHGGRLEVHSAVGRGSTFRVILPASSD